jgi:hypothetical protein
MGKKEILLPRDQRFDRDLFDPQQHIATVHIHNHRDTGLAVFLVLKDPDRRRFHPDFCLRKLIQDFLAGCWGKDHPVVRGIFAFPDQSEYHSWFWYEICAKIVGFKRVCKYRFHKRNHLQNHLKKIRYLCNPITIRPRIYGRKFFENMGPTGFDSEISGDVSMPSAGIQLVNLIFQPF